MSENQSCEVSQDIRHQEELPLAVVRGRALESLPKDLYIPPQALEVILESFEGPLDLLLYLIRRQNLDVLDIPIAEITAQYMEYVELMKGLRLELAAEYLVMAAVLAEIKPVLAACEWTAEALETASQRLATSRAERDSTAVRVKEGEAGKSLIVARTERGLAFVNSLLNAYEIGKNHPVDLGMVSDPKRTLASLAACRQVGLTTKCAETFSGQKKAFQDSAQSSSARER